MLQQCWSSVALDVAEMLVRAARVCLLEARSGGVVPLCQSLCCFVKEWTLEFGSSRVVVFLYILGSQLHAIVPCWWWLSLGSCILVLLWLLGAVRHVLI